MFDSAPYEIKRYQKASPSKSGSDAFSLAYIYVFFTEKKYKYIVRIEKHNYDVFILKYYLSRDKKKEDKYKIRFKQNGPKTAASILRTCLEIMIMIREKHPEASFAFNASSSLDKKGFVEDVSYNQRFRVYVALVIRTIGSSEFEHFSFKEVSSYLLVNKSNRYNMPTHQLKDEIREDLLNFYDLPDLID